MKSKYSLFIVIALGFLFFGCKKKTTNDNNNNTAPQFCNLANATSSINDTIKQINHDTSYSTGNNTFYAQHLISDDEGISVDFEGSIMPQVGNYTITSSFTEVKPGSKKCYLQYFRNGESYVGQAGQVEIGNSGSFYFCKIVFKNTFGLQHTVSLKAIIK